MLSHYRPDGRLVELLLSFTLVLIVDKSPLTFIYFTTFEEKSQVSPTTATELFGFWYTYILYTKYEVNNNIYINIIK